MKNTFLKSIVFVVISVLFFSCEKQIDYQPQINDLKSNINNLQKSRDSLANVLSSINSTNTTIIKSLDSLKNQITVINTQIATLNTQMLNANANIASLTTQIAELNKKYTELLEALNLLISLLNLDGISNGLIAYFPFDGNIEDKSVSKLVAVNTNALLTSDRYGIDNKAYAFNGTNSKIVVNSFNKILGNTPFSVNFWVYPESGARGWMLCFGNSENGQAFECGNYEFGTSNFNALIWTYNNYPQNKLALTLNQYQNITATYDGSIMKVYLNGNLSYSLNVNYVTTDIKPGILSIGKQINFNEFFKGKMDEIRIYNRVLSQTEISVLSSL
jgi:prefoldin subunit 5